VAFKADRVEKTITATVLVVHDNWHSAIVLRAADLSPQTLPEMRDFPDADYLEFSWGDREYFPHPGPGVGLALKAAFRSSGSIIHVVGVRGNPASSYPNAEIIAIGLDAAGLERLVQFVSAEFVRADADSAGEARPGLSENARFYLAHGNFSILRTCNTWVAEALAAAQLPIDPAWVITARSLGSRIRPLGELQ
jgi:uncharacterized protein (TIGR02117 family)